MKIMNFKHPKILLPVLAIFFIGIYIFLNKRKKYIWQQWNKRRQPESIVNNINIEYVI